jgi:hypothetical protein
MINGTFPVKTFAVNLIYKISSRKFWVWIVTTVITSGVLQRNGDHNWITPVIIVWGLVSFCYFAGDAIVDAIGKAIEKANINVGAGK